MKIDTVSTLYHGTAKMFQYFDLRYAKMFKDFGKGFYLTTNFMQAQKWAQQKADREKSSITYIYQYKIKYASLQEYKILELLQYDEKWLDFIADCRIDGKETDYDIIYDKMADNRGKNISQILDKYKKGIISASDAVFSIRWKTEKEEKADQYCFKTQKALKILDDRLVIMQQKDENGIWKIAERKEEKIDQ